MLPLLATERNNIWEALRYALREQDIERSQRIFRSVYIYFFYCGDLREVTRQISAGLAMLWSPQLINGAGWVAALRGDYLQADAWFAQILDSGALSVDHSSQTLALRGQAYVAMARQEHTLAAQILAESLQVSARNGDVDGVNYAHFDRAFVALASEDLDQAERMYEDLLPIVRSAHDQIGVLRTTLMLARIKLRRERYRESAALYHTAWKLWGHVQAHQFVLEGIEGTAAVAVSQGDYVTAALLCGAAEAARAASGEVRLPAHRLDHDRTLAVLRSLPESPEVSQAWAEGRAITFAQAVTEAIAYTADASSAQ